MQDVLGGRDDDEPRTLAFECDNNQELRVRLSSDRQEARVEVDDQTYRLEEAGRDNGQRVYSDDDDDVRLTVGDDEAYLRIPGEADYQDCERT
jgi:Membrane-bound lysozyme-inhibitor of c-type lysozyme